MGCLKEALRSGRARFSQELAQAIMDRMELSKRPVEQVWFRESTLLWRENNYIKLFGSAQNVVEQENSDQRDEKKKTRTRPVREVMRRDQTGCGRHRQDRMAHKTTHRSNTVWTNSTDNIQHGSARLFSGWLLAARRPGWQVKGQGGGTLITLRASVDHSAGGIHIGACPLGMTSRRDLIASYSVQAAGPRRVGSNFGRDGKEGRADVSSTQTNVTTRGLVTVW